MPGSTRQPAADLRRLASEWLRESPVGARVKQPDPPRTPVGSTHDVQDHDAGAVRMITARVSSPVKLAFQVFPLFLTVNRTTLPDGEGSSLTISHFLALSAVRVLSKMVPAVTLAWCLQLWHTSRFRLVLRGALMTPHLGQTNSRGQRSF